MIRRPPRSTQSRSSAASDVYKRQVHEVAGRVRDFYFDEHYSTAYGEGGPDLGIAIGGYTPGQALSERYEIMVAGGHCTGPEDENAGTSNSLRWRGQGEAITRLVLGFGVDLPKVLQTNLGVPDDQLAPVLDV